MIKCKTIRGRKSCQVFNQTGHKPLSKPGLTRSQAIKRLKQVDYFKSKGK